MVVLKRIKRSVVVSDCDDSQSKRSKNDCDEGRKGGTYDVEHGSV